MRALLIISLLALVPDIVQADVSLVYPQQAQCQSTLAAIKISGSRMRFDSVMENKKYSMLFDGTEETVTQLDHTERQYHQTEVDEDALDYTKDVMSSTGTYINNQMKTVQAQMQQQCAQMKKQGMSCPDIESMMRNAQAMAGQAAANIEIRQSDKQQLVAGMACTTYDRFENGTKVNEACYIKPKDFLMPDKDKKYLLRNMKVMLHYGDAFAGLTSKFSAANSKNASSPDPANKDILLLQVCLTPNGDEAGRVEVQISHAPIDESSFEIPAGYQVMDMAQ